MNLAIKGHPERGNEVIERLEMLGGINTHNLYGDESYAYYTIDGDKEIKGGIYVFRDEQLRHFTLEEFEEKFPYKVGDTVWLHHKNSTIKISETITSMRWCSKDDCVLYDVCTCCNLKECAFTPYKEELTMKKKSKLINIEPKLVGNESVHFPIPSNMKLEVKDGMCYLYRDCCEHKESKCLQDIKEYLDNATPEQLEEDWKEIEEFSKAGPIANEYVKQCKEGVNLQKLERQLDEALEKETTESLNKWMDEENYCQVIGNDTSSNGVNTSASLINGEIIEENINDINKAIFKGNAQSCDIMNNIIKDNIETITIEDFKANTKEWLINKLGSMSSDDALQAICNIHDELHKPKYPKTYVECAKTLESFITTYVDGYKTELLEVFQKLLICRDAYWKIAGDWKEKRKEKAIHHVLYSTPLGEVVKATIPNCIGNYLLDFPTEEMRDVFYENFKELIEQCKELL